MKTPPRSGQEIADGAIKKVVVPNRVEPLTQEEVDQILESVDLKGFKVVGHRLLVRVSSPPEKTKGGIFFPTTTGAGSALYDDRLGSKVSIVGDILVAGPDSAKRAGTSEPFKPGERVFFSRMNFIWIRRIEKGEGQGDWIGFIDPAMCDARVEL